MLIFIIMTYTEKDKKYIIAGLRERILLEQFETLRKDFGIITTTPVTGGSKYDGTILSATTNGLQYSKVEIKIRTYNIDSYPDDGWIIEEDKYKFLMKQPENVLYINFFAEGCRIWDLKTLDKITFNKDHQLPFKTMGDQTLINKPSGKVLPKDSSVYYYKNEIFKAWIEAEDIYDEKYGK